MVATLQLQSRPARPDQFRNALWRGRGATVAQCGSGNRAGARAVSLALQIALQDIGYSSADPARLFAQRDNFYFKNIAAIGILAEQVAFGFEARG